MTKLEKISVSEIAAQLDEPFTMANIAYADDVVVSVYICQGKLQWHEHVNLDELFWVHEGTMLLESEWGNVMLRQGELVVVPKGVRHRSSSRLRASVLLLRCSFPADRKNGRCRLYTTEESKLKRVNLREAVETNTEPLQFQTLARIEDVVLQAGWGQGNWPTEIPTSRDRLLYVVRGTATVRTPQSMLHMHSGDLTVVPRGAIYGLISAGDTTLVQVTRESTR